MLDKLLKGSKSFYAWVGCLLVVIGIATGAYIYQLTQGLVVTGMSRDVSWGFYIAQFTYLVGVAASAVMLVIPAYFHGFKPFKKMLILGEFLAIAAVIMCMMFIVADMGQPQRVMNVILHPTPNSIMFWDMCVLTGYLILNLLVGWVGLECEKNGVEPPKWIKTLVYVSAIWAFSIHTVTAFLYAGLPGRHYWLTAILAARFLASAFCSGPAILLLLALILRRLTGFDPGRQAIRVLSIIITYAMSINVFFFLLEVFTAFYSQIPGHSHPFAYLFGGHDGHGAWINGWMYMAVFLALFCLALLIPPGFRNNEKILPFALVMLVIASWIDKGLALMIGGFTPNVFDKVTEYAPSLVELTVGAGIFAVGLLILSCLWKIALEVKKEAGTFE
ncbi:polysulfide reductase NrfD [Desulfovibrio sp. OttesenSCG-928-O18]|nr:polysulfide reductase NrfD [Desulfovibrio sp. OttesenSCG-928-O18]